MTLRLLAAFLAAALALVACGGGSGSTAEGAASSSGGGARGGRGEDGAPLTVMSRNLYVGGDLFLPFVSEDPLLAASAVWGDILASDVPGRMAAVAAEIRAARPRLVGLQEVYRFVVTPLGAAAPVLLDLDFLALLEGALESPGRWDGDLDLEDDDVPGRGRWRVAVAQPQTVLTVPFPEQGVQITMIDRDAILVGPGVEVLSTSGGSFAAEFVTSLGGIPVRQRRGFTAAEVRRGDATLTFVNVHLETKTFGPLQSLQAQELLARVPTTGTVVLAGDLNSGPEDDPWPVGTLLVPTPYQLLGAVLDDAWTRAGAGPGLTCCFPADLRPPGDLFERVDVVLVSRDVAVRTARRVGTEPLAALGGRWPSDHAGVVAALRVPEVEEDEFGEEQGRRDPARVR